MCISSPRGTQELGPLGPWGPRSLRHQPFGEPGIWTYSPLGAQESEPLASLGLISTGIQSP